jgi:hypothetical protein
MMTNGTFTHIFHPNNEKMFENASIDIIVFRYYKNNLIDKKVLYNDKLLYITNSNGLITFGEKKIIIVLCFNTILIFMLVLLVVKKMFLKIRI